MVMTHAHAKIKVRRHKSYITVKTKGPTDTTEFILVLVNAIGKYRVS